MTNFKGTKGKWIQNGINGVHLQSGMCIALTHSEDRKANALLISKAPEMLEMLERMILEFEIDNASEYQCNLIYDARKLIKEATTL